MERGQDRAGVTGARSPEDALPIVPPWPDPAAERDPEAAPGGRTAIEYMDLAPGDAADPESPSARVSSSAAAPMRACPTCAAAAAVLKGRRAACRASSRRILLCRVQGAREAEGSTRVHRRRGWKWRETAVPICASGHETATWSRRGSAAASTTNRNFRSAGPGARTHLRPAMVAAAAVTGRLTDLRRLRPGRAEPHERFTYPETGGRGRRSSQPNVDTERS